MLAAAVSQRWPAELAWDFRHYLGLDSREIGKGIDPHYAGDLISMLPAGSRVAAKLDPAAEWTEHEYRLAQIEYDLRGIAWIVGGGKKSRKPKPPALPAERARVKGKIKATDMDSIAEALGLEVEDG